MGKAKRNRNSGAATAYRPTTSDERTTHPAGRTTTAIPLGSTGETEYRETGHTDSKHDEEKETEISGRPRELPRFAGDPPDPQRRTPQLAGRCTQAGMEAVVVAVWQGGRERGYANWGER